MEIIMLSDTKKKNEVVLSRIIDVISLAAF